MQRLVVLSLVCWGALAQSSAAQQSPSPSFSAEQIAFFEKRVRPILVERCEECHSGDEPESGLRVDSRAALIAGGELGPALRPGDPKSSLLIRAINHNEFLRMPPKEKLSTREVLNLTQWVQMGAPWPDLKSAPAVRKPTRTNADSPRFSPAEKNYWAFQPLLASEPPQVRNARWPRNPIDRFVLAKLEHAKLDPAPPANRRTLIRRATFDLTGLPPTPAEVEAFVSDTAPGAYERLLDRLLASPAYGERWGRHWLDIARYADSNGLDENLSYANAYHYRDYVIASLNRDKPYATFVQEQIAGDLLPEHEERRRQMEQLAATGFLAIGPKMLAEDDPVKMQMDIIDEQISTIGQALLGLTIGCARCHDHKFDPLRTADYYSLAGIFKSSKTMENHKVVAVWFERPLATAEREREITAWKESLAAVEKQIQSIQAEARVQVRVHLRKHLKEYLLASLALERLHQISRDPARRRAATTRQDNGPFPLENGFALLEAEDFHRGDVESVQDGYGAGIGIIGTRGAGYAEYDLDVKRAGEYVLEVRFAAADSRPVGLFVNGQKQADAVLGQVTGTWYPDSQRWFVASRVSLKSGANTIKLQSPKVYPHIDRLAVVWAGSDWPFDTSEPISITRQGAKGLDAALVASWEPYFERLIAGKIPEHRVFLPWARLRGFSGSAFQTELAKVLAENAASGEASQLPQLLRTMLIQATPASPEQLAQVYADWVRQLGAMSEAGEGGAEDAREIDRELASAESPLAGPKVIQESSYPESLKRSLADAKSKLAELQKKEPKYDLAMGVTEGKPEDLRVHLRGSHLTLGGVAPRGMPRVLAGEQQPQIADDQSGRLELARWLTDRGNPLFYRVIVNRVWRWRFGRGIVASVDNLGALGEAPSHPELLDWLTVEFQRQGGSLKSLHRTMMLSSTYRMSTAYNVAASKQDPENKLLWRMNRRRLSGEEVRDSMLQLGPGLDRTMGGTLLKVKNRAYVTSSNTNITSEFTNQRRSVYLPVIRSAVYEVLQTLDFPDPAVSNGDRATTTVAPQALLMMNSSLVEDATKHLAERTLEEPESSRIAFVYRQILNRPATAVEFQVATTFLDRGRMLALSQGVAEREADQMVWSSLARVLMSSNEYFYIE